MKFFTYQADGRTLRVATWIATFSADVSVGSDGRPDLGHLALSDAILRLAENIISSRRDQALTLRIALVLDVKPVETLRGAILRVIDELVTNACEHGFYGRASGSILITITSRAEDYIRLLVEDDGWGFPSGHVTDGNGFTLLRQLGELRTGARHGRLAEGALVTLAIPGRPPNGLGASLYSWPPTALFV
jgi:two-component sensor histidine kinase